MPAVRVREWVAPLPLDHYATLAQLCPATQLLALRARDPHAHSSVRARSTFAHVRAARRDGQPEPLMQNCIPSWRPGRAYPLLLLADPNAVASFGVQDTGTTAAKDVDYTRLRVLHLYPSDSQRTSPTPREVAGGQFAPSVSRSSQYAWVTASTAASGDRYVTVHGSLSGAAGAVPTGLG